MSLRAKSHSDLQAVGRNSLDDGLFKSLSVSSGSFARSARFGTGSAEEVKGLFSRNPGRPVRAVRPVSAVNSGGSFFQLNHLQGELVRKRKECEDLKKENRFLSNEIHMERITMRSENELTMRNLRNLNQELQTQLKELRQKMYQSQQRATLCSRAADQAEEARGDAEKNRTLAEARALVSRRDREATEADRTRLGEELELLKKERTDLQLSLARAEKNYFEAKLNLDRVTAERAALTEEKQILAGDGDELRQKLREISEENVKNKDSELSWKLRATALDEELKRVRQAQQEAEAEGRLLEKQRQEKTTECLVWREKHQDLSDRVRAQEDLKALRQNKGIVWSSFHSLMPLYEKADQENADFLLGTLQSPLDSDLKALLCQANIKSFFLCMTESDQRVKILKNPDGLPRNFTEGDPVFLSTPESSPEEPERSSSRTMFRVCAPNMARDQGPTHFDELPAFGGERPDSAARRRSRKVVDYFWIPTDQD